MSDPIRREARKPQERRSVVEDFRLIKAGVPRAVCDEAFRLLREDGLSLSELIRLCLRAYVQRHPAALAMVDQLRREKAPPVPVRPRGKFSSGEMRDIWAAIGDGGTDDGA